MSKYYEDASTALLKAFEINHVFPHMHSYELYRKWLENVWAFLNAGHDLQSFREKLDKYNHKEGSEFGRLFNLYTDAVEQMPFRDILGEIFMKLDVNSVRSGQFFTPQPIAEMMAGMQFSRESFEERVKDKGEVTVMDPAVGSGVMLLAFAKVVHDELGRPGVNKLRLYGMDIDERCVLMCRIQLRMNGLDAFGRMACLLNNMTEAKAVITQPEAPDISNAVIFHSEDIEEVGNDCRQLALL